jgi:hypothetical protein
MTSLFNPTDNLALVQRIERIGAESRAHWGTMNASQMLAHLQAPIKVALGQSTLKRSLLGLLFGPMIKRQMLGEKPFKRNLPTDKQLLISHPANVETEKAGLIQLVQQFTQGPTVLCTTPHPFFGPLTPQEWDRLVYKHIDHHLQQFGA